MLAQLLSTDNQYLSSSRTFRTQEGTYEKCIFPSRNCDFDVHNHEISLSYQPTSQEK